MNREPSCDRLSPVRFAALLAVLLAVMFPGVLLGSRSFFHRDFGVLAYPTVFYHRAAVWRGEWPLWNPLSHCGVPFLAQWGTMVLYPGALIYLLLPLPWSLDLFCLAHLWLAGFGMYWLARHWTAHGTGAALAGIAFVFNGVTQSCLLWPNYIAALGWMPWVVLAGEQAARRGGRAIAVAAIVSAMQLLTGAPELIAMTWLALAVMTLGRRGDGGWRNHLRGPARLGGVAALTLGLGAAQLLPFLDLLARSQRSSGFGVAKWALPPWGAVNFLLPLFHCYRNPQGLFFQPGQEFFSSVYLGGPLLALAALGFIGPRPRRIALLALLAFTGLVLSLGDVSPLHRALPFLQWTRYPVKWVLLIAFVVPLLGAFGLKKLASASLSVPARTARAAGWVLGSLLGLMVLAAWFDARHAPAFGEMHAATLNVMVRALFLLAAAGALGLGILSSLAGMRRLGFAAVLACIWLDYAVHTPHQNPTLPAQWLQPGLGLTASALRPEAGRVFITPAAEAALLHSTVADLEADYVGKRLAEWSNLNLLDGVAKVNGAATLRLAEEDALERRLYLANPVVATGVLDLLGVAFQSAPDNATAWVPRTNAPPLVTAGQSPQFVPAEAMLDQLLQPAFDPRWQVLLSESARTRLPDTRPGPAVVSNVTTGANRMEFQVETDRPALVVIAQTFHPNWQARVNGTAVRIERTDYALQAIVVPAGRNTITLVYRDRAFLSGLALSAATLLLAAALVWRAPKRAAPKVGG
ncbi:MAG: hypothetical protein ABSC03_09565 [Verrucomicrobiota bacterium]